MNPAREPLGSREDGLIGKGIAFCLQNKFVVILALIAIVFWGVMVAPFDWKIGGLERDPVPVDAIPDIGENQQIVFTKWMGRSPEDIEDQITYPLTSALLGIPGVKTVRSLSMFGFSSIYVIFKDDIEFYWSRTRVLEKLSSLPTGTLPEGIQPMLGPDSTPLGQVFWYTLEGVDEEGEPTGGWDLHELRSIQDWQVRYELLAVPGVSEAASVGGFVQEYQVEVDPDAMRAYGVMLHQVLKAVKDCNLDIGARTMEINKVEYVIRGLGFIKSLKDISSAVVKQSGNVPIRVSEVAHVTLGPAIRRGALDKGGAEAVGGVVVVRYGANPLEVIKRVKEKIKQFSPTLPEKALIDFSQVSKEKVEAFAFSKGFSAFKEADIDQNAWLEWIHSSGKDERPEWLTLSRVSVVPFYDRTGLIYETLGTLNKALSEEILVTIIVVVVLLMHLRSSVLISGLLPLAVLMCFIAMKYFHVDANVVALSGIAIAIGTMVDMGIILNENILKHLNEASDDEPTIKTIYRAAVEVGSAVMTAVATTVISFLPVFAMEAAEGKLFKPLAYTKTFALVASLIVALTLIPPFAHMLFGNKSKPGRIKRYIYPVLLLIGSIFVFKFSGSWFLVIVVLVVAAYQVVNKWLPARYVKLAQKSSNWLAVFVVAIVLTKHWMPLGVDKGLIRNLIFTCSIIGGLLFAFRLYQRSYGKILRWCLNNKVKFLLIPCLIAIFGILYVWLGVATLLGPIDQASRKAFKDQSEITTMLEEKLLETQGEKGEVTWSSMALTQKKDDMLAMLQHHGIKNTKRVLRDWSSVKAYTDLKNKKWKDVRYRSFLTKVRFVIARDWDGLGKEFMPTLDEGSFLFMPTTTPHASIGEAMDVLSKQDIAITLIPEVDTAVGKIGRADSPLDPAPISMIETTINYKPEYIIDQDGHRETFRFNKRETDLYRDQEGNPVLAIDGKPYVVQGKFARENGALIPDKKGKPFRLWRPALDPALNEKRAAWPGIRNPTDIWDEIVRVAEIPGTTSAPMLQPIATRIVMLQSGMRAPMGVKIFGKGKQVTLEELEKVGIQIEKFLKHVPSVKASAVNAERIVGKPYLELDIDRDAISRYGVNITDVQHVIQTAIGGMVVTTTVEGRERYPVLVRYKRELRDTIESLERVLVPSTSGQQIPLKELLKQREIKYRRGPQVIKSEDSALVTYVLFDKRPGYAEVDVKEDCERYLNARIQSGDLKLKEGITYKFAGTFENQIRSEKRLMVVLPIALFLIFMILYLQFRSVLTSSLIFTGVFVAWSGGFIMLWLYGQDWFFDFSVFGVNMRDLFQMHTINLSVAVWVGFLALFGIATDDGVVMATYLDQSFEKRKPGTVKEIREATHFAGQRRIRPCLMTTATTILALIPVLTSTGRGADIMVPMAIPCVGGMAIELITMFVVPVLYCAIREAKLEFAKYNA